MKLTKEQIDRPISTRKGRIIEPEIVNNKPIMRKMKKLKQWQKKK